MNDEIAAEVDGGMDFAFPLDKLYKDYKAGVLEKQKFEGQIFQSILKRPKSFGICYKDRDDCIDYLSWLYPRLTRAVDRYQNTGSSFDAFMGMMVRLAFKEYRGRKAEHDLTEKACWSEKVYEVAEPAEPSFYEGEHEKVPIGNPRQVLILLLKSYYFVSDDFMHRVSMSIDMDPVVVGQLIERLRIMRSTQEDEIRHLRENIQTQYYRCISLEKKLTALPQTSARYEKTRLILQRSKRL
jgi:hypothetical protein